jgi:hypothetical protein
VPWGEGLVCFHKLSQWLTYSLVEPLLWHGLQVTHLDALTGLAEYRNGGLWIDRGVLCFKDPKAAERPYQAGHPLIIEWRGLTVILLDELADALRQSLGLTPEVVWQP